MKNLLIPSLTIALLGLVAGCSDDDGGPTGPGNVNPAPQNVDTTVFDATNSYFVTTLTAKQAEAAVDFSDLSSAKSSLAGAWDIKFANSVINLNGGASADGGDVFAFDLGEVAFDEVTAADSAGVDWVQDELQHIVNEWYSYNFQTHQLVMTGNVYTLTDAEGDNYIEFRVDSITGGGQPPAMGTVWFTYFYNTTANNKTLTGTPVVGSVLVNQASGYWGYFDFSAGAQVYPANPATSTGWDIGFNNYEVFLNSSPNGSGSATAFPMFGELNDATSLEECTAHPAQAPMFQDYIASIFNGDINDPAANWYNYNGTTHELTSKAHVYLILNDTELYKLRIESYYRNIGGVPTSGYYTIVWNEL